MRQKHTLVADAPPMRVVFVTLDNHLRNVVQRTQRRLQSRLPSLQLSMHAASNWDTDPNALAECKAAIAQGDIIVVTMLFMENHIQAVMPELRARRDHCDAMICCMTASEVMKQTRMGRFSMEGEAKGPMALLKRLRGKSSTSRQGAGAQQLSVLRRLPRILRFIPGTAQDVRAYFLTLQYWLAASEENLCSMVQYLVDRYARDERAALKTNLEVCSPIEYPEVGIYHPAIPGRISDSRDKLPKPVADRSQGTIGVLIMRSYALAGNTAHYDAVIEALEAKGYRVITAFASGLDARPAIKRYFFEGETPCIDGLLSLTGFSLVGGPAYNDANAAEEILAQLNVPYISAQSLEFQSVEQWQESVQGLTPIEATMMVAIPELEGATGPMVFGGRSDDGVQDMEPHPERIDVLASRIARLAQLRKIPKSERKLAIVLFNFPPNAGSTGTAAYLSVFESLYNTLQGLQAEGYDVALPETAQALQDAIINGNATSHGVHANVAAKVDVEEHVRNESWLSEIEAQWGPAPGKHQSDGRSLFVLGVQLGNIMIGVQPAFGYEGDPMRLLFEGGFSPTHAFSAFYRYLRQDFGADSVLHFGTHGALEFMPGKQVGMSETCWPDRLIGDLPNFYLYASNNPSEALLAKRRSAATMITYLTPPVTEAQLYRGLSELKESIDRWRKREDMDAQAEQDLVSLIRS
ncbi:MAG: magnesium chelatase subunit H, partial [Pseudomonadota bacterium]